ncbi:lysozyme inhibitor LprI family protein [Phenylobacterium sp.]|uniref:lysozyme inhibitor LprI family protein n=1 Tax=Phenylobacterium sp. TaxID=1871053 RepID=UPI0025D9DF6A|nr:lysozyme inhibitor LprI family protein [Phenylobacterium sp.]
MRGSAPGFQSYADDTPREFEVRPGRDPEPRSWDEPLRVRPGAPTDLPSERRATAWPKLAVAAAVLAAFGGGFLLARTDGPTPAARRPVSESAALAAARPMNVEVAEVAPLRVPPPSASAKLEVLPRAQGAPSPRLPPQAPASPREAQVLPITPRPAPLPLPPAPSAAREIAEAPVPRDAAAVEPARVSFDCRDAPSLAREMVCGDAGLAAMDRRMKRAYAAAVAAGARQDELAADQADWLDIREEAARRSRRSVANIYRQRIDELQAMAERDWR